MAINKIKINGTEHEIQTTIANITNLQASLDAKQATVTGGASTITSSNLTASRALVSNSSGKVAVSDVTSTELGYLDGVTSNVQTQLNNKTSTAVIPNNSGEIKTKYRMSQKGFTNGAIWYYKICDFPTNNSGNYASAIVSGRIGGWTSGNMSYINSLVWNRENPGIALFDIAGAATSMSSIWNIADLVLYVNGTSTTAANTATLYVKCSGYFTFDLDLELFQSGASITYDGTYVTSTPSGTLTAKSSTTTRRVEVVNGQLLVNGTTLLTTTGNAASATKATKDASGNVITSTYETKTDATNKLAEAKAYADTAATTVKNNLLNGAGAAYDTLKELGDLIDENTDAIEALETVASNKMDKVNPEGSGTFSFGRLSGSTTGQRSIVLGSDATASGKDSAVIGRKGKATGSYATSIGYGNTASGDNSVVIGVNSTATSGNAVTIGSGSQATNWNAIAIGAATTASGNNAVAMGYGSEASGWMSTTSGYMTEAVGGAQTVLGSLNVADTAPTDDSGKAENLVIVGNGDYESETIVKSNAATIDWDGNAWFSGDVYVGSTSGTNKDGGSKMLATVEQVNTKANTSHTHTVSNITDLTATATELNYMDGVTSNVQTQLNGKAASSHNHAASNITSGTLSSDRLPTVPITKGGTGATTASAALTNLGALPKAGGTMTGNLIMSGKQIQQTSGIWMNSNTGLYSYAPSSTSEGYWLIGMNDSYVIGIGGSYGAEGEYEGPLLKLNSGAYSHYINSVAGEIPIWNLLWENSSPSSNFATQTITVDGLSKYNMFMLLGNVSNGTDWGDEKTPPSFIYSPDGDKAQGQLCTVYTSTNNMRYRSWYVTPSSNTVYFYNAWYGGNSGYQTSCIPVYLFGIKI